MTAQKAIILAGALCACLALSGCGGTQFTYAPDHELKKGPGILSGQDGEFVLINKEKTETQESETTVESTKKTIETP